MCHYDRRETKQEYDIDLELNQKSNNNNRKTILGEMKLKFRIDEFLRDDYHTS